MATRIDLRGGLRRALSTLALVIVMSTALTAAARAQTVTPPPKGPGGPASTVFVPVVRNYYFWDGGYLLGNAGAWGTLTLTPAGAASSGGQIVAARLSSSAGTADGSGVVDGNKLTLNLMIGTPSTGYYFPIFEGREYSYGTYHFLGLSPTDLANPNAKFPFWFQPY